MHTVYGIYVKGAPRTSPSYIGVTKGELSVRFTEHVTLGRNDFLFGRGGRKAYWMYQHDKGDITLEIRPLETNLGARSAMLLEAAMINKYRPILNTKVKMLRPGRRKNMFRYSQGKMLPKAPQGNPLRGRMLVIKDRIGETHWIMALSLIEPRLTAKDKTRLSSFMRGQESTFITEALVKMCEEACDRLMVARKQQAAA